MKLKKYILALIAFITAFILVGCDNLASSDLGKIELKHCSNPIVDVFNNRISMIVNYKEEAYDIFSNIKTEIPYDKINAYDDGNNDLGQSVKLKVGTNEFKLVFTKGEKLIDYKLKCYRQSKLEEPLETPKSIFITSERPYELNSSFKNLDVILTYENGYRFYKRVTKEPEGFDTSTLGIHEIDYLYNGEVYKYKYEVVLNKYQKGVKLTNIDFKSEIKVGEAFKPGRVLVEYVDGTTKEIEVGADLPSMGKIFYPKSFNITIEGLSLECKVVGPELSKLKAKFSDIDLTYDGDEHFIKATYVYEDGSEIEGEINLRDLNYSLSISDFVYGTHTQRITINYNWIPFEYTYYCAEPVEIKVLESFNNKVLLNSIYPPIQTKLIFNDGTIKYLSPESCEFINYDRTRLGIQDITIKAFGCSLDLTIEVVDIVISSIKVSDGDTSLSYFKGEAFKPFSIRVDSNVGVYYVTIPDESYIRGFDNQTLGKHDVTLVYKGCELPMTMNVNNNKNHGPFLGVNQLTYCLNAKYIPIPVYFKNSQGDLSYEYVPIENVEGFDTSTPGNKTVTITYKNKKLEFIITVLDKEIVSINIGNVKPHMSFDEFKGASLYVIYSDGSQEIVEITRAMLNRFSSQNGNLSFELKYKGFMLSYSEEIPDPEIIGFELIEMKTDYVKFEDIGPIKIKVTYTNRVEIKDKYFNIIGYDKNKVGTQEIIIYYRFIVNDEIVDKYVKATVTVREA